MKNKYFYIVSVEASDDIPEAIVNRYISRALKRFHEEKDKEDTFDGSPVPEFLVSGISDRTFKSNFGRQIAKVFEDSSKEYGRHLSEAFMEVFQESDDYFKVVNRLKGNKQ